MVITSMVVLLKSNFRDCKFCGTCAVFTNPVFFVVSLLSRSRSDKASYIILILLVIRIFMIGIVIPFRQRYKITCEMLSSSFFFGEFAFRYQWTWVKSTLPLERLHRTVFLRQQSLWSCCQSKTFEIWNSFVFACLSKKVTWLNSTSFCAKFYQK